ncbi:hypothetical protein AB0B66_23735 [Catellatospora sp. NPDC049111]|uniref:hypothetical protein n=1 Tax=Catellatospora sp. NPDC049111 TaxID=3155271 RepID=UPI0033DC020D
MILQLTDCDETVSHGAIALFDEVRVDSEGTRLGAQWGQVHLGPQELVNRGGVPSQGVGGSLLLTAAEEEDRGCGTADEGGASREEVEDCLGHDEPFRLRPDQNIGPGCAVGFQKPSRG